MCFQSPSADIPCRQRFPCEQAAGSEARMKPLGNAPRVQVTSPRLLPRAAAAHRGACAKPQLRDKDARLISAGHKVDVAGDRPVKALGIRACHSRHRQVFISGSRPLLPLAAPGSRCWHTAGLSLLTAWLPTGGHGPSLISAPSSIRNQALSAHVSLGDFFPFPLATSKS